MSGRVIGRRDLLLAALLFLAASTSLLLAARQQGFTRDEGYYFNAAELHWGYIEESFEGLRHGHPLAFADRRVIERGFSYNNEHPPLMKTLFGLSWRALHRCDCPNEAGLHPRSYPRRHVTLGLLSQGEAMRLPANLLAGLLCAVIYLFGARAFSRRAGLCAAGLTLLAPRFFFHAQLSCFDAPIAVMLTLTTLAYYQAEVTGRRRWLVTTAVLAGLSLSTKHNAFFLPFVLLIHSIYVRWPRLRAALRGPSRARALLRLLFAPWIIAMALLSLPVYLLSWPWLWYDTARRFSAYVGFHLHHVYYNIEYLGHNYNKPPFPWHYVLVTTLLTLPVVTQLLAALGAGWLALRRRPAPPAAPANDSPAGAAARRAVPGAPGLLLALGALWPALLIARPGTPIFGAEKHWLPSLPFLALLAGAGLFALSDATARALRLRARGAGLLGASLLVLALLPPALEVRRSHPYALSHYNALAGGPAGGADLGMNRHFWGYAVRGLFPWLDQRAPASALVYWHDANGYQLQMSIKDHLLRRDLRDTGLEEPGVRASDIAVVIHERHFNKYEHWIWDAYGTTRPQIVLTHEGVPLVTLYQRPAGGR